MTDAGTLYRSGFFMIVSVIIGFVFLMGVAAPADIAVSECYESGVGDAPKKWTDPVNPYDFLSDIRLIGYAIPILGIFNFIFAVVRRQRYTQYGDEYGGYEYEEVMYR